MTNRDSSLSGAMERGALAAKLAAAAIGLSLILCGIVFFADVVFQWSGLRIFTLNLYPLVFALAFSVSALVRAGFFSRMLREEEEKILLARRKESVNSILDVSEDVRFSAQRHLSNFDKYVPSAIALLAFLLGGLLLYLFQQVPTETMNEATGELLKLGIPKNPVNLAFLSIVCCAFAFFGGIFLVGQSHVREYRWLRPVGSMLVFSGITLFLSAAGALLYVYGKPGVEPYFFKVVFALECVLTVEFLVSFVIEFYRPRSQEEIRPVYESRVLSLFTEPGGVVRNMAESLDYQFGFKVSKTSVYQFVQKVFVPSLMIWAFLLWIFTCLGEVGPGELGIRERFGAATGEDLQPGIHWKLPWPFERIISVPVSSLQKVVVGAVEPEHSDELVTSVILWTSNHYIKEDPFLVASRGDAGRDISYSVAILETSLPIFYRAKKNEIRKYAFQFQDIPQSLLAVGKSEATAYFASTDFLADISDAREKVCADLKERIQKRCDGLGMGIEIVSVDMMDAHPPIGKPKGKDKNAIDTNVAEAFQMLVIAQEDAKSRQSKAEAEKAQIDGSAKTEAAQIASDSFLYKFQTVEFAKAESNLFQARSEAFRIQPEMFALRIYLDFLMNDCRDLRKYVVSKELMSRIYEFNFEEKAKVDLLEDPEFSKIGENK